MERHSLFCYRRKSSCCYSKEIHEEFQSQYSSWRNSIYHKVTAEEKRIAIKTTKAMDLKVAGVDTFLKGPLLLEVNSSRV
jgi:glutathione synthase/RimK-type ligase-like ATP-grasp enzyme